MTTTTNTAKPSVTINQFVQRHIVHCVSYMVSELTRQAEHFPDWEDDLYSAHQVPDYETAVHYWIESAGGEDLATVLNDWFTDDSLPDDWDVCEWNDTQVRNMRKTIEKHVLDFDAGEYEDFVNEYDINVDDYQSDVYEHWVVSPFLARYLENHGEKIISVFDFDYIWCRTTTSQSIAIDYVITKIYDEIYNS